MTHTIPFRLQHSLKYFILFLLILCYSPGVQSNPIEEAYSQLNERGEAVFTFQTEDQATLQELMRFLSIDLYPNKPLTAYANPAAFDRFLEYQIPFTVVTPPSLLNPIGIKTNKAFPGSWNSYPSYEEYVEQMEHYASTYPGLCLLDTIGTSVEGRLLLALKISDNAQNHEAEPEFLYTSTMHGDEVTGYVLLLRLAHYLLSNYATDRYVQQLVDHTEIWINPNANPDGSYADGNASVSGATRFNANGFDLNRNFPDPRDDGFSYNNSWEPEIEAMMHFMQERNFVLSANYHGGAEVMNYPWDTWYRPHPDEDWFVNISKHYADSVKKYGGRSYFSDVHSSGITNGADWYVIEGGRQDFTTYYCQGREITIEVSSVKMPLESMLPSFWEWNRAAMLHYIEQCQYGIYGTVTNAATGDPLKATISLLWHDTDSSQIRSDSIHGDYYRMVAPGNYQVHFRAPGFNDTIVEGIVVDSYTSRVELNMAMDSGSVYHTPIDSSTPSNPPTWNLVDNEFQAFSVKPQKYCLSLYSFSGQLLFMANDRYTNTDRVALPDQLSPGNYVIHLWFENGQVIQAIPYLIGM